MVPLEGTSSCGRRRGRFLLLFLLLLFLVSGRGRRSRVALAALATGAWPLATPASSRAIVIVVISAPSSIAATSRRAPALATSSSYRFLHRALDGVQAESRLDPLYTYLGLKLMQ